VATDCTFLLLLTASKGSARSASDHPHRVTSTKAADDASGYHGGVDAASLREDVDTDAASLSVALRTYLLLGVAQLCHVSSIMGFGAYLYDFVDDRGIMGDFTAGWLGTSYWLCITVGV
jgi:hypothetical protein